MLGQLPGIGKLYANDKCHHGGQPRLAARFDRALCTVKNASRLTQSNMENL